MMYAIGYHAQMWDLYLRGKGFPVRCDCVIHEYLEFRPVIGPTAGVPVIAKGGALRVELGF